MRRLASKIRSNKKIAIFCGVCILVAAVIVGGVIHYNNRWKSNIDVKYIGYNSGKYDYQRYHVWEITNESGRNLKNVTITFKVSNNVFKDFTFEQRVGTFGNMKIGETKTVELYWNLIKAEAEDRGITLLMANVDILRITYD